MAMLYEREHALAAISTTLTSARQSQPGALFIAAEPGLGKTTLLTLAGTRSEGFEVRLARCTEVEAWLPFGLLDRLFGELGMLSSGGSRESSEARLARYAGILSWLRQRAAAPLLLAIDDLHWADKDSLELLSVLVRRLANLSIAVVATLRPWPSAALAQARLLAADGAGMLEHLEPLSEPTSAAWLSEQVSRPVPPDRIQRACQDCAGNPLLLAEVGRAWEHGEDLFDMRGQVLSEQIFLRRFAGVSNSAFRWASVASVLGTRFRPGVVASLTGQPDVEVAESVQALSAAGLLRGGEEGITEFVHPLFRQALYEALAEPVRRALHATAFRILRAHGAEAAEAASHALRADLAGDPDAIGVLTSAGHTALAVGAVATATEHFQGAVHLAGARSSPDLLHELADAYLWAGRVDLAGETVRRLLGRDSLSAAEQVAALRLDAQVLLASACHREAKRRLEEASREAERFDVELAAGTLLDCAFISWLFEGPRSARATVRRALRLLRRCAAGTQVLAAAINADTQLAFAEGDPSHLDDCAAVERGALVNVDRHRIRSGWDSGFGYASLAKTAERFEDSQTLFTTMMETAERQGAALTYQIMAVGHAETLWRLGRLHEARQFLDAAAEMSELVPFLMPFSSVGLANACHELGADEDSAIWAKRVERFMSQHGEAPYLRLWLCLLTCRNQLRAGQIDHAVTAAERAATTAEQSGILEPCVVPWHSAAIEAYLAADRLDQAIELAARLEQICAPLPCHAPRAVAATGRAAVAWRLGHLAEARQLYQTALAHNATVPMPLAEAETLIGYGRFLRHTGHQTEARDVLHRALDVLEPTGAGRLESLASEELATAGGRRRRDRPASSLTAQEERVAALAARGLTNLDIGRQLFISPKTVDHHLARVYAKLRVRSRRELILAWRDQVDSVPPAALASRRPQASSRPPAANRRWLAEVCQDSQRWSLIFDSAKDGGSSRCYRGPLPR
jgi:DNA-binding CsgD family transcriptional regulator